MGWMGAQKLNSLLSFLEELDYSLALPGHQAPWTKEDQLAELRAIQQQNTVAP